jgi:uncharacterized alpha-E superfamily protein
MLSRIADSLYWLARYMGRAEDTARILDVNYYMMLEQAPIAYQLSWEPLLSMAGEHEHFQHFYSEATAETVFEFLAFRRDNPSSIVECVAKARENARSIRDFISREMWEDINSLYHTVHRFIPEREFGAGPHRFCGEVRSGCHRFYGVRDATLAHDEGWEFLRIGASLERAEVTARLAAMEFRDSAKDLAAATHDTHQWLAVLRSVGAYAEYRRQYQSVVEPKRVAEMLILHPKHPRSVRFSTIELQSGLRAISGTGPGGYSTEAERLTGKILEGLRYATIEEIFERGLQSYMSQLLQLYRAIGVDIGRTYFYYSAAS